MFDIISVISFDQVELKLEELNKQTEFEYVVDFKSILNEPIVTICKSKANKKNLKDKKFKFKQTFASSWRFNNSRTSTNVINNRILKPWNSTN